MAASALEALVPAVEGEMLVVVEFYGWTELFLPVAGLARARKSVRMNVLVARDAVLAESKKGLPASQRGKVLQSERFLQLLLVALPAGQGVVLPIEGILYVRMPENSTVLGAPGDCVHQHEALPKMLGVTAPALDFLIFLQQVVVVPHTLRELCRNLLVAMETPLGEALILVTATALFSGGHALDPGVCRRDISGHRRIDPQHSHHEKDQDAANDKRGFGVE